MEERVLKVLKENNEDIIIYDGCNMIEAGIVDSFEVIGIISDLEEEFDIEIDAEYVTAENFANKEAIINLIKTLIKQREAL